MTYSWYIQGPEIEAVLMLFSFYWTEESPGFQIARHNLSYIQEIGNGWFGQVPVHFYIIHVLFPDFAEFFFTVP